MVAEPLVESIPSDELASSGGRRRILSDNPAAKAARDRRAAQKAAGGSKPRRGPAKRSPRTRSATKSLASEISASLSMLNMIVVMTPLGSRVHLDEATGEPVYDRVGDELDEGEIALLAQSLDAQCQRSPKFRKQVERFLGIGAGGSLIAVLGMIAARRASRHGILPPEIDAGLGAIMVGGDLSALSSFVPSDTPAPDAVIPETGERPPRPLDDEDAINFDDI
jgi:hypothetical protein